MKATLIRDIFTTKSTTGIFTIYGDTGSILLQCFALEDVARAPGVKIPGNTAIPAGPYKFGITNSVRFDRPMPIIYNQPDMSIYDTNGVSWSGIRIHWGNFPVDTDGCLIVGSHRPSPDFVNCHPMKSIDWFNAKFFPVLIAAVKSTGFIELQIFNKQSR